MSPITKTTMIAMAISAAGLALAAPAGADADFNPWGVASFRSAHLSRCYPISTTTST